MAMNRHRSIAVHPGIWLREEMVEPLGLSSDDVAGAIGLSVEELTALLKGEQDLTEDLAQHLEHALGVRARTLMKMQRKFDLARSTVIALRVGRDPVARAAYLAPYLANGTQAEFLRVRLRMPVLGNVTSKGYLLPAPR